jgi:hypothetical protein
VVRFVLGKHVLAHFEQKSDSSHRLLLLLTFATNITHNTHHRSSACGSMVLPFYLLLVVRFVLRTKRTTSNKDMIKCHAYKLL